MDARLEQARSHAATGMQALGRRDGMAARTAFERAISLGWPGPDVWVALAHARGLLGEHDGRRAALEQALNLSPDDLRARLYLADHCAHHGDTAKAAGLFASAIRDAPDGSPDEELSALLQRASTFLETHGHEQTDLLAPFQDLDLGTASDDTLFIQSLDILAGRARPFYPQPTRYLYPGLPIRQFYPRQQFPWAGALEGRTPQIRAELEALLDSARSSFKPYVERQGRETGVSHHLLDNPDWGAFYLVKQGHRIEENIARCPVTMAAIDAIGEDAFPAPAPSVLFSRLAPGTAIPPHHGMFNTRLICHLPLIIPQGCGFRVGNERREWTPGRFFAFDDTIEHEAWNSSGEPRYILIFELWRPELDARQRALVTRLFQQGESGPGAQAPS